MKLILSLLDPRLNGLKKPLHATFVLTGVTVTEGESGDFTEN